MDVQTARETDVAATTSTSDVSSHLRTEMCPARQPSPPPSQKSHESPTSSVPVFSSKQPAELTEPTPEVSPIDTTSNESDKAQQQPRSIMDLKAPSPVRARDGERTTTPTSATSQSGVEHETDMSQPQQDPTIQINEQQLRSSYAYCYDRGDGVFTRLVPLDMLPPLDSVESGVQDNCLGMIVLPQPRAPPPPESHFYVTEAREWQTHDGSFTEAKPPAFEVQSRIDDIVDSTVEPSHKSLTGTPTSRSFDDALRSPQQQHFRQRFQRNSNGSQGLAQGNHTGNHQHQHPPRKRIKIYCDKWVHEGVCAFTQQGCKFKHEMPFDRATQHSLGLFHGLPAWWKKSQQLADVGKHQQDPTNQLGQITPQQMLMLPYHQATGDGLDGHNGMGSVTGTQQDYNTLAAAFDGLQMGPCDNSGNGQQVSVNLQPTFGGGVGAPHPAESDVMFSAPDVGTSNVHNDPSFTTFHPCAHLPPTQPWLDLPASQQQQNHQGPPTSAGLIGPPRHGWNVSNRTENTMNNNNHHNVHRGSSIQHGSSSDLPLRRSISEHSPSGQQQNQSTTDRNLMASRGKFEMRETGNARPDGPAHSCGLGLHGTVNQVGGNATISAENAGNSNFFVTNRNNSGFASRFGPIAPPPHAAYHTAPLTPMSPLPGPALANNSQGDGLPRGPLPSTAARFPLSSPLPTTSPHHNRQKFSGHQQHKFVKRGMDQSPAVDPSGGVGGEAGRVNANNTGKVKSNPWQSVSENDSSAE